MKEEILMAMAIKVIHEPIKQKSSIEMFLYNNWELLLTPIMICVSWILW
jgi:hypothetical protein